MPCGCKKSNCSSRVCRCKKAASLCTQECACTEVCKNRSQSTEVKEIQVSWQLALDQLQEERALIEVLSQYITMPDNMSTIYNHREGYLSELKEMVKKIELDTAGKEVLSLAEWEIFQKKLIQCKICERKFQPERIGKHEDICVRRTFTVLKITE